MGLQNVVPQSRIFFEYPSVVIQPSSFRQAWLRILSANTICSLHYLRGEYEIRTRDLLLARQALSQLSYTPICLMHISYLILTFNGLEWTRTIDLTLIRRAL